MTSQTHPLIIAIDGPSGAGKGTVARHLAAAFHYRHVDTGAMYRAVAWKALQHGVSLADEAEIAALCERSTLRQTDGRVFIDADDVTSAIRTPEIDRAATSVARLPRIREILVAQQRALGAGGGVVMEGRDIGTVVFPRADVKVYLDASAAERARRRVGDAGHTVGQTGDLAGVQSELQARDRSDSTRPIAPLSQADDAAYIDTTDMPIADVVSRVTEIVRQRLGGKSFQFPVPSSKAPG